jgi:type VI secretion system secreted protein Hcp
MGAVDYFLKVEGIEGESKDSIHQGEIDLQSWSWGQTQSATFGSGGGGGAGKVSMQDFHFVMYANKASPKLMEYCASGEHISEALLTCRKAGSDQQEFLKVKFNDVLISSYQTGGAATSSLIPTDQIALNFAKIEFEYHEQMDDGTLGGALIGSWNQKLNRKG